MLALVAAVVEVDLVKVFVDKMDNLQTAQVTIVLKLDNNCTLVLVQLVVAMVVLVAEAAAEAAVALVHPILLVVSQVLVAVDQVVTNKDMVVSVDYLP